MTTVPKRGGTHPIFGLYVGGDALTNMYHLASSDTYSSTSHLRGDKVLQVAESSLHSQRNYVTSIKFNGKLEITSNTSGVSLTEPSMESFFRSVVDVVERFGLKTFFYAMDTDSIMKYLPEEPHNFTLATVIKEHTSSLVEPAPTTDNNATNPTETSTSILARFKSYDAFEKCDLSLSHLVIESLVRPDLRAEVVI